MSLFKSQFFIQFAIELAIVLPLLFPCGRTGPKLRQQSGPGPAGSWAGPAWFKMLLGLGGNQGGGGWKWVISCTSNITFHWILQTKMLKAFAHTSFSIRVFWLR